MSAVVEPPATKTSPLFEIGPDSGEDIRTARPYFVVPLLDPAQTRTARERVVRFLQAEEFTDVYLISHGWHRNFFSAVAAYDRLISRFAVLMQRGRLAPAPDPYRPLFFAMHWNSDPDEDGWNDTDGRRLKDSFLANAGTLFEPMPGVGEGALLDTLEDAYEYMTFISSPDVHALRTSLDDKAHTLYERVKETCAVRDGPSATPAEKIAVLWRCYAEATPQRVLLGQSEPPRRYSNPLGAISNLFKFLVAALGLTTLLGLAPKILAFAHLTGPLQRLLAGLDAALRATPPGHWLSSLPPGPQWATLLVLLTALALVILYGAVFWQETLRRGQGARGLPVLAVGSWLPLQALAVAPLLIYLFATFLFRTSAVLLAPLAALIGLRLHVGWVGPLAAFLLLCALYSFVAGRQSPSGWTLFRERLPDGRDAPSWGVRDALAWLARRPIALLRRAVAQDSQAYTLGDALDKQLAFWTMQRKAVQAGQAAGQFVADVSADLRAAQSPALDGVRLHLIGHSFGGLVMVNAARFLAAPASRMPIQSLTLLQAALASAWFETEPWCRDGQCLRGALACVYSAYDMANGFYYPASNSSRMAAGYVGLCAVGSPTGTAQRLGKDGLFASLVQPPNLGPLVEPPPPYALNLDASRLIYAGSPAAGGGHDDVYKDDVIHMLWAITQL